jgi:CBS domain-containing protein
MLLRDIMTTNLISIGPDETANAAWSRMEHERIRHLVVLEEGRLVGILSIRDLGGRKQESFREGKTVRDLMTPRVMTATPDMTLDQAFRIMQEEPIGSLPVQEDGELVGIVTATDVLDELGRGATRPRTAARERGRKPDSAKRAPFAEQIPRAQRREQGRTAAAEIPAYIRSVGPVLDVADRELIRRKLGRKLGKFAFDIERASVRVEDVNGPRGGVDKLCRIKIVLSGLPSVVAEDQDHDLKTAIDGALARAERAVRRAVERRKAAH